MRKWLARGLVIATAIAAIVAVLVARAVLSPGSGTYFAVQVMAVAVTVPGALVWWQPRFRWFLVWAVVALVASVGFVGLGDPDRYEEELAGWVHVEAATWIAMAFAVLGSLAGVFYLGGRTDTAVEPLARRLRRIVHLVVLLALGACAFSWLPAERVYAGDTYLHTRTVGGVRFVALVALMVMPALLVYRDPRKRWAWLWWVWTLPSAVLVLAMMFGLHIFTHGEPLWPQRVIAFCVLTLLALVLLGVPLVTLVTRRPRHSALPQARLEA